MTKKRVPLSRLFKTISNSCPYASKKLRKRHTQFQLNRLSLLIFFYIFFFLFCAMGLLSCAAKSLCITGFLRVLHRNVPHFFFFFSGVEIYLKKLEIVGNKSTCSSSSSSSEGCNKRRNPADIHLLKIVWKRIASRNLDQTQWFEVSLEWLSVPESIDGQVSWK